MIITYCADRNLYSLLPTTLNALFTSNPNIENVCLLIEDNDIPFIRHPKIKFINCSEFDFLIKDGINCRKQFPYMAMTRCFMEKVFPEEHTICYMDVDTIVNGDISELLNTNISNYIAAAREESNGYFNSGVMIFNLDRMRKDNTYTPLYKLLSKCPYQFPDQDAMNAVFANKVLYLPHKFNALGRANVDHVYETDWVIRHFAGIVKPWKENANEQDKELWNKYYIPELIV